MATKIAARDVSELRQRTGAGMMDCKRALEETGSSVDKAVELLRKKGIASAEKRADRVAQEGAIASYMHFNGQVGVLVEINCETDFVARTDEFKELARNIALHVASARPLTVRTDELAAEVVDRERTIYRAQAEASGKPEKIWDKIVDGRLRKYYQESVLLEQPYVKDDKKTVGDLVKEVSGKLGENVVVRRFVRYELGAE